MKKNKVKQQKGSKKSPLKKETQRVLLTVDDPINDIHDDELYEEKSEMRIESPIPSEPFERPW